MWARTTPNFSFVSKPTRRRFLPVMRRVVQVQSRVVLGCVRYECGGSLKPGAVEHAGVPRGGQGKGAYLISELLNPQLLTLSPRWTAAGS